MSWASPFWGTSLHFDCLDSSEFSTSWWLRNLNARHLISMWCCFQILVPWWQFSRLGTQFTQLPQSGQIAKPSASRAGGSVSLSVSMVVSIFTVIHGICETYCRFLHMVHVVRQWSSLNFSIWWFKALSSRCPFFFFAACGQTNWLDPGTGFPGRHPTSIPSLINQEQTECNYEPHLIRQKSSIPALIQHIK